MKITTEQLKQIIKEEVAKTLHESVSDRERGKDDGLEDAQATEMGMQVYGPSDINNQEYMKGYLEGNPNYQP
ncbi:MAG: hypothetical protein GOVbin1807_114 [Prokaryotic dsDNA virus sp.]|nr:MAG: hypothetical protein GOVbin1807_114 [Prokaryotic dsDNA virus sp.]|tara:strand:- start:38406 stop:38621 length:216 start_codon:yes stop_codon:yes gene_type:complete